MPAKIQLPILLNYGGASKSSFEMSLPEFKEAAAAIRRRAREKAFSKGLPVYVSREGKIFAEYPNGDIEEVVVK